jgi:lipid-binding SYLF domain-containing protein
MSMFTRSALVLALPLATALLSACETAPKTAGERATLSSEVTSAVDSFRNADPSLNDLLAKSVGYAIFPDIGKAGFIAGGAYGRGEVFEAGQKIGYADVSKGSIGLQAGAQTFSQLIIFMRQPQLDELKSGKFAFAADASAVAIKAGAAAAADYSKGAIVFTQSKGGLMAEASIGGQNFSFQPLYR